MPGLPTSDRGKRGVLAIVARIPAGRLSTPGDIGRHLAIAPRHVATILSTLTDTERATLPWWRVVADGGAIGRHRFRDVQMQKLKAEGVPVAPVGIVGELQARRVLDLAIVQPVAPAVADATIAVEPSPRSRARGIKSHPSLDGSGSKT